MVEPIDPKKASKDDIAKGLELLAKEQDRKRRIESGELKSYSWKDMTPEQKERAKLANKKRTTRIRLEVARFKEAVEKGICDAVTDAEVEAAMAS